MSTSVSGKVVNQSQQGIDGLVVVVRHESGLFPSDLGKDTTKGGGNYTVTISPDHLSDVFGSRELGLYVRTGVLANDKPYGRVLHTQTLSDGAGDTVTVQDITLRAEDVTGWPVSLPGTTNALPVRQGNALLPLVDNILGWGHVAAAFRGAQKEINVMQLGLDMPHGDYKQDATQESPEIVLGFPDTFDGPPTKATDPTDFPRPERLLLDAAAAGKQVRVMMPDSDNLIEGLVMSGTGDVSKYFTAAHSTAKAVTFLTTGASVVHAKAVLIDAVADGGDTTEGILLGSPFEQSYFDSLNHPVYEPRRGSCHGEPIPVHDVSIGVRGPAVADLQAQYVVHWNKNCQSSDTMQPLAQAPPAVTVAKDGEYLATVQLVRSVNHDTLPGLATGEEGVLEAYLRAIENATDYIYFENQYFTSRAIGDALIGALVNKPNLKVILMLNVVPDMPFYPAWQTSLIGRIRSEAGAAAKRLGVFTAWSHTDNASQHKHANPVIMPNYLHTKTAIIDGKWATVGSANLDGASLDEFQFLRIILGVNRNDELNVVVFNDPTAQFPHTDFVDQLRLTLWSEHLGIPTDDPRLSSSASSGWLQLWTDCAGAKLQGLVDAPGTVDPSKGRVLAYPPDAWSGALASLPFTNNYRNFLKNAKTASAKSIDLGKIDLVRDTTAYDFAKGKWSDA
jgi:phosphatidylserine/phosphatidylglycerophosphate/cardiolipin synthase-like enzyme